MRVTRARAQQGTEEAIDATERAPLNEITSNTSPEQVHHDEALSSKTPAKNPAKKGKGKSRGKKGKRGKAAEEEEEEQIGAAPEDEQIAPGAPEVPARTTAGENESEAPSQGAAEVPAKVERPVTPPSKPIRLTRRQLAIHEEEMRQSQRAAPPPQEPEPQEPKPDAQELLVDALEATKQAPQAIEGISEANLVEDTPNDDADAFVQKIQIEHVQKEPIVVPEPMAEEEQAEPTAELEAPQEVAEVEEPKEVAPEMPQIEEPQIEEPATEATVTEAKPQSEADHPAPSVEISSEPEPKTLATEKPSEDAMTPLRSHTSSRRASRSPSKSPMRLEESFEAIDALEEALENVTSVARIDRLDERSPERKALPKTAATPAVHSKARTEIPNAAAKVSRAPSAAAPKSMKPMKSSIARASSVRVVSGKDVKKAPTETTDYLASKRRPVSVSFPTPPPPPKGRAPTKPIFQLSSNDTVAKLKAQKEERLKREVEGTAPKARPISMPPPPKSNKPLTKPAFQLPGERIAEKLKAQKEERLKREAEAPQQSAPTQRPVSISMAPLAKSTKAPTKASFELPGSAVAEKLRIKKEERLKRMEEAEAAKREAAVKPRQAPVRKPVTVPVRQRPGVTITAPQPQTQQRSISLTSKRSSMSLSQPLSQSRSTSTSSANRSSVIVPKATVTPVDAAQQKLKGREVFNRDRMEKEARERERKEKEEAAKRARAEAAERGRIASREWAEKQRKKMMGA